MSLPWSREALIAAIKRGSPEEKRRRLERLGLFTPEYQAQCRAVREALEAEAPPPDEEVATQD
jgi:hypothetical protein